MKNAYLSKNNNDEVGYFMAITQSQSCPGDVGCFCYCIVIIYIYIWNEEPKEK